MVEHGTTAGSQNELANILLQLLLCHLASSEVTDVKCIFSVLPSGSCLYNNRVTCRIWLRVIPRITSRILVTQTLKWKKLTRKVLLAAGITGTDYCRWVRGSGKLYIPMFFMCLFYRVPIEVSTGKEGTRTQGFLRTQILYPGKCLFLRNISTLAML